MNSGTSTGESWLRMNKITWVVIGVGVTVVVISTLAFMELSFELSNFQTMIIEISIGGVLAVVFFWLQHRTSDKVNKLIQQKASAERENKRFQCQKIIDNLQEIQDAEQNLKTYLNNYKVEDKTYETLRLLFGMSFRSLADKSIYDMNYAVGQLQSRLNDHSLSKDFLDYLGAFNVLPDRILKNNMPQEGYQCKGLLSDIDKQTGKIKHFIERFKKETDST